MRSHYIPTILIVFLQAGIQSCKQQKQVEEFTSAIEANLQLSSQTLDLSTFSFLKSLEEKTVTPCTRERAIIWYENAECVVTATHNFDNFVNSVLNKNESTDSIHQNLSKALLKYFESILFIDSSINQVYPLFSPTLKKHIEFAGIDTVTFFAIKRKEPDFSILQSILCLIQNDLHIIQNKLITFCNTKVGVCGGIDFCSAIIAQSSNYLRPNSNLEIIAGVGAFSKASEPEVTINGQNVLMNPEGNMLYRMKVNKKPGKYYVPVRIKFNNPFTGIKEDLLRHIEYTVVDTCPSPL